MCVVPFVVVLVVVVGRVTGGGSIDGAIGGANFVCNVVNEFVIKQRSVSHTDITWRRQHQLRQETRLTVVME